jgi:nucleoid-associated protein YgaU
MRGGRLAALLLAAAATLGAAAPDAAHVHQVRRGDTLWRIAEQWTGDGSLWPALYRANRDQIRNPALLHPGQRLSIPEPALLARWARERELPPGQSR